MAPTIVCNKFRSIHLLSSLILVAVLMGVSRGVRAQEPRGLSEDEIEKIFKPLEGLDSFYYSKPKVKANDSGSTHGILQKPRDDKDKKEDEQSNGEEKDTGIKVNGQTLWEDSKGNRYYYINGDKSSPFISVQQPDGNFKWSTMDAMLNKPAPANGLRQIGMIETTNGKLAVMYETAGGGKAFSNGSSWFEAAKGQNSFAQVDKLTVRPATEVKLPPPVSDALPGFQPPIGHNPKVPAVELLPSQGITAPYSGSGATGGSPFESQQSDIFQPRSSSGGRWVQKRVCGGSSCRVVNVWVPN